MVVEKAKGAATTGDEVNSFLEWLLCTWDPAHRMELVTNDIRVDREGVDVELMVVLWYSQTPKDIAAMYATCNYGKQYEELLETARHLGERWYAMVKFCETRFAHLSSRFKSTSRRITRPIAGRGGTSDTIR